MSAKSQNNSEPSHSEGLDDLDFSKVFNVLWRGKILILICALIGFFIGGFYAFRVAVPIYPARAIVQLKAQNENIVDIQGVVSNNLLTGGFTDRFKMQTEIVAMTSRNMMSKLIDHLDLMDDPRYNPTLRKSTKGQDDQGNLAGFSIKVLLYNFFSGTSSDGAGNRDSATSSDEFIRNKIINQLSRLLEIQTVSETYTFQISATTTSAAESVRLVNGLAEVYIQDAVDEKFETTERASQWLSQKAAELKIELQESEQRIKEFSDGTNLINAESLELQTIQLKDLRQRIDDLERFATETQNRYQVLSQEIPIGDVQRIVDAAKDTQLARIAERFENGTTSRELFDARAKRVLQQLEAQIDRNAKQIEGLTASEASLRLKIAEQSDDLVELQQLTRETQASGLLYESFLSRLKEISVQQGLLSPSSRLLSPAVPLKRSEPKRPTIIMVTMVFGAFLAAALLLVREFMNKTFRSPEDLEDFSRHRLLGTVPKLKEKTRAAVLRYAVDNPTSAFAEAVRNLRTTILLTDVDNPPQVIMSTSSMPAEGKTTMSLTLAQNMAGLGKRVLVLECDIRKRVFAEYFDIEDRTGFIAVMTGEAKLADAVYSPEGMGIDILLGEKSTANAADIFSSQKFGDLIKTLRKSYDYIVIDTPPVLAVPDARVVAQHVDTVIYSVRWDKTERAELKNGLALFDSVGMPIGGLVMTQLDSKQMKKYGYTGSYGYHYGDGVAGYTNG